jgi:hypothetical protein
MARWVRDLVLATHGRPSYDQASPSKLASDPDLRQINPVVVTGFITIRVLKPSLRAKRSNPVFNTSRSGLLRRFAPRNDERKEGSRTPKGAYFSKPPHQRVRLASSGTRSPSGVPPRHLRQRPNATAQLQHVLPGTWLKSGRYPPPPVPVQRVAPQTGRNAGRTYSPEPPECRGDEPLPAGTALAPPDGVTDWRPSRERELNRNNRVTETEANVKENETRATAARGR